jgi:hypothetical protein
MAAEVCREHRDEFCKVCDESNDDLWAHPRDLPGLHETCPLCRQLIIAVLTNTLREQARASGEFFNEFFPCDDDGVPSETPLVRMDGAFDLAAVADILIAAKLA